MTNKQKVLKLIRNECSRKINFDSLLAKTNLTEEQLRSTIRNLQYHDEVKVGLMTEVIKTRYITVG